MISFRLKAVFWRVIKVLKINNKLNFLINLDSWKVKLFRQIIVEGFISDNEILWKGNNLISLKIFDSFALFINMTISRDNLFKLIIFMNDAQ